GGFWPPAGGEAAGGAKIERYAESGEPKVKGCVAAVNTRERGRRRSLALWMVSAAAVLVAAGLIGVSLWQGRSGLPGGPGSGTASEAPAGESPAGEVPSGEATLSDADLGAVPGAMGPADARV